jgi:HEAT repeat protein
MLISFCAIGKTREELQTSAWPVIEKGLRSGDVLVRAIATQALYKVVNQNLEPYIQDALKDPDPGVQIAVTKALARMNRSEALDYLDKLLRSLDPRVEEGMLKELLQAFPQEKALHALSQVLLDEGVETRKPLLSALFSFGAKPAATIVAQGLKKGDKFFDDALSQIPPEIKGEVLVLLASDKDPSVQVSALTFARDNKVSLPQAFLKGLLKSKDTVIKTLSAENLAMQGDATALPFLLGLLDGSDDDKVRFLKAFIAAPNAEITKKLEVFLSDETPEELLVLAYQAIASSTDDDMKRRIEGDIMSTTIKKRVAGVVAYPKLKGTRGLGMLHDLVQRDGNPTIRKLSAQAIGELAQGESVPILERALRDPERDVRIKAVEALSKIRDRAVINVARYLVFDRDPEIRKKAIIAMCRVNHADALPVVRGLLHDQDPEIRYEVIRAFLSLDKDALKVLFEDAVSGLDAQRFLALAKEFGKDFLPFLEIASNCARPLIRSASIKGAPFVGDAQEDFLVRVAKEGKYADTRKEALLALSRVSCEKALQLASSLFSDPHFEVRLAVADALHVCGNDEIVTILEDMLSDPEEVVRVSAATFLLDFPKTTQKPKKPKK